MHVVDASSGPGTDFADLRAASDAAADGDVLLVRAGSYDPSGAPIVLDGKGLVVVSDAGVAAVRVGQVHVRGLPAGRFAAFQGLLVEGFGTSVSTTTNAGALWLERCILRPGIGADSLGANLNSSAAVVWSRCFVQNQQATALRPPGAALVAVQSRVHVFDSEVRQLGRDRTLLAAPPGIQLWGAHLYLAGSVARGGNGMDAPGTPCVGQGGGPALELRPGASTALVLDSALLGGEGGDGVNGCQDGADAPPLVVGAGASAATLPGSARSLRASSPVRELQPLVLTLEGLPGDRVSVRYALAPGQGLALPHVDGEDLLGAPRVTVFVGTLPASGTLTLQAPAPALPAGAEAAVYFVQALFREAGTNRFVHSSPSAAVVLDSSL